MSIYNTLRTGDPAPWFFQRSSGNPSFAFNAAGGRYLVLCFLGSAADPLGREALETVKVGRRVFDDEHASYFSVTLDPADESEGRLREDLPGLRALWDFDGLASRLYGALPMQGEVAASSAALCRQWIVLDPTLRVIATVPFSATSSHAQRVLDYVAGLPPPARFAGVELQAPVLFLPNVFEAPLCERLIAHYEGRGGETSGFMRDVDGRTVVRHDLAFKSRKDCYVEDAELLAAIRQRIKRRIVPEILKVHQFSATRMERDLIACYAADDGGHFRAHRDNTTKGTAHRRFAVSINLNSDFEGGEVSFPEYGPRGFKPPPGGAVVFSCSLLHAVSRVTRGRRYAFLPFLYDEEAAKIRQANNAFLGDGVGTYHTPEPGS